VEHNIKLEVKIDFNFMAGQLAKAGHVPPNVDPHVRTIQNYSNPGSHHQPIPLDWSHLEGAKYALVEFLEWFYNRADSCSPSTRPEKIRESLLHRPYNTALRKRYLAVRTPWLKVLDSASVPLMSRDMKLWIGIFGGFWVLFSIVVSVHVRYGHGDPSIFSMVFLGIIAILYVTVDSWVRALRMRKRCVELGPLPPNAPLNRAEARKRYLEE
jgi:hypothetical protein